MKKILSFTLLISMCGCIFSQNIIIQQNNGQGQTKERIVEKVVEKPVYIKPTQKAPICIAGFLYVFPEDLGSYEEYPATTIANINKNKVYGKSHWRLPTEEEFNLMIENKDKLNLIRFKCTAYGNSWYRYWTSGQKKTGDCSYRIRLVCTE